MTNETVQQTGEEKRLHIIRLKAAIEINSGILADTGDLRRSDGIMVSERLRSLQSELRAITEVRTTIGNYRRMRIVRWDGGSPIKQDRDGNFWRFGRNCGQNKCTILPEGVK